MQSVLFILGAIALLSIGLAQLYLGYLGIEETLGWGWAVAALFLGFVFKFNLPIIIGTYFGVTEVLHWHWIWGILIAAPGLALAIPGTLATVLSGSLEAFKKPPSKPNSYADPERDIIDIEVIEEKKPD